MWACNRCLPPNSQTDATCTSTARRRSPKIEHDRNAVAESWHLSSSVGQNFCQKTGRNVIAMLSKPMCTLSFRTDRTLLGYPSDRPFIVSSHLPQVSWLAIPLRGYADVVGNPWNNFYTTQAIRPCSSRVSHGSVTCSVLFVCCASVPGSFWSLVNEPRL